jgi:hypothetical protein
MEEHEKMLDEFNEFDRWMIHEKYNKVFQKFHGLINKVYGE